MPGSPNLVATAIVIIGLNIGVSLLALWLVRRSVPHERLKPHNDVSGFVYAVIGVVYAVIIAFVLVSAWEQYREAEQDARREAAALGTLHRIAQQLPEPGRQEIQDATLSYALAVVNDEWPHLLDGDVPGPHETKHTDELWSTLNGVDVSTPQDEQLYAAALDQLHELTDFRLERMADVESRVLGIMWAVMIVGGVLTVLFPCLFGVENGLVHSLIVAVLAATIGLLLLTVYELNHPYQGAVHIEPDAFELVIEQFSEDIGPS